MMLMIMMAMIVALTWTPQLSCPLHRGILALITGSWMEQEQAVRLA